MSLIPNAYAETLGYYYKDKFGNNLEQKNFDPYTETDAYKCARLWTTIDIVDGVETCTGIRANPTDDGQYTIIQETRPDQYAEYLNMDFGTHSPGYVEVYASAWQEGRSIIVSTEDGTVLATIPIPVTTDEDIKYKNYQPHRAQINTAITGVHNIRIGANANGGVNIDRFKFEWQYETITAPKITVSGSMVKASASIKRNLENDETRSGKLILCEYNQNGSMVKKRESSHSIANGGATTSFNIPNGVKDANATGFGAYFLYSDDTEIAQAAERTISRYTGNQSQKKIEADAYNGWVTVSGSGVADGVAFIAVAPSVYDESKTLYEQTTILTQLFRTTVTGGKYNYKFKMPDTAATGNYKAVIKSGAVNECVTFSYTTPDDTYGILQSLESAANETDAFNAVKTNASVFGVKTEMFASAQSADMLRLKSVTDTFFASNPLTYKTDGDYSLWTNGLKNVIVPEAVVSHIKNVKNSENIINHIDTYNAELGISSNTKYTMHFEAYKEKIAEALIANAQASSNGSDFVSMFEEAVVVGNFNGAESWGFVAEALQDFETELFLATPSVTSDKMAIYNRLANKAKQNLLKIFINKNFVTVNQIAEMFMRNIDSYNTEDNMANQKYELEPSTISGKKEFTLEFWHKNEEKNNKEQQEERKGFLDLDEAPWAKTSINYMYSLGVVSGKSDTQFAPNDSVTREEFAVMVVRAFGFGTGDVNALNFYDVDKNSWYAPYLAKAYEKGIITGIDENNFGIGQNITREQIAAILQRAVEKTDKDLVAVKQRIGFVDFDQISSYAYDAVRNLAMAEVINGTGNDKFSPKKNATRAEAVVMLCRLLTNIK